MKVTASEVERKIIAGRWAGKTWKGLATAPTHGHDLTPSAHSAGRRKPGEASKPGTEPAGPGTKRQAKDFAFYVGSQQEVRPVWLDFRQHSSATILPAD